MYRVAVIVIMVVAMVQRGWRLMIVERQRADMADERHGEQRESRDREHRLPAPCHSHA
jgi:hypothetical protein